MRFLDDPINQRFLLIRIKCILKSLRVKSLVEYKSIGWVTTFGTAEKKWNSMITQWNKLEVEHTKFYKKSMQMIQFPSRSSLGICCFIRNTFHCSWNIKILSWTKLKMEHAYKKVFKNFKLFSSECFTPKSISFPASTFRQATSVPKSVIHPTGDFVPQLGCPQTAIFPKLSKL